jgi:hypothetical protein
MIDLNFLQRCGDPPQLKFITPEQVLGPPKYGAEST